MHNVDVYIGVFEREFFFSFDWVSRDGIESSYKYVVIFELVFQKIETLDIVWL